MDLVKRMKATQRTVDRFQGRPFHYGSADCIRLVVTHAKHMGRKIPVPKYRGVKGAADVLRGLGFSSLSEAMDAHFERIAPAQVLLGDIVEMPGDNGFSGLTVAVGNGRVIGFHQEVPFADILQPLMISGAWRIQPKSKSQRGATSASKVPSSSAFRSRNRRRRP